MDVLDNLLRNSLMSLSSFDALSISLSSSAKLINDTMVITSFVLGSIEFFLCSTLSSSLHVLELNVKERLFAFLDFLFTDVDLIDRSTCDI
jgi:hypothetical protein